MKEIIYLAGQISPIKPETYEWRKEVKKYFLNHEKFIIIDPCGNSYNRKLLKTQPTYSEINQTPNNKIITPKDKSYVERSTIGIINLIHYDPNKPIIGSLFELAWYQSYPSKTVIGIYEDTILVNHPFVQNAVTTWLTSVHEACKLIDYYFN